MAERIRSESFQRIKFLFISALLITLSFSVVALVIALKTCDDQLNAADEVETDPDVKNMYSTIRPILTGLIVFVIVIEWVLVSVGLIGAIREHYVLSVVFAVINSIGLLISLFQIGPVLFALKIIWILIDIILTSLSCVFVYSLRYELLRPRFCQN